MLHLLRRAAKTWAFRALFALLIVSFAVWGVGDLSFGGAGTAVATVGERRITVEDYGEALAREISSLSRRAERTVTVEEARAAGVPQQLLARIVRDAALDEEAARLGLSADDRALRAAIEDSPSFQGLDGRFDPESYRFILDRLGFSVERFEADLRRSLAREAVARGVAGGAPATPGFAEALVAAEFERRGFTLLRLPLSTAPEPEAPDEAALRAHYSATEARWRSPETRAAVWLEIDPEALAAEAAETIPEDALREAYAAAADRFQQPERRLVDRLAFADAAAAAGALAALEAGETGFAALVAERGLSPEDVDEGEATAEDLPAEVAAEIFASDALGAFGPFETPLGPAIFNVRAVLPARTTSFEAAAPELRAELARIEAVDLVVARAEEAADLLASGAGLEAIAEETGLPLRRDEALTRSGPAAEASETLRAEVFAAEPGEERDLIETPEGGWLLVRVDDVTEAAPQPFETVEAELRADWTAEARRNALADAVEAALAELAAGATLDAVAASLGATPEPVAPMRRAEALARPDLPESAVDTLFAAEPPAGEGPAPAAAGPLPDGWAILVLDTASAPDLSAPRPAAALAQIEQALAAGVADDLAAYWSAAVQARIGATFNEAAIEQTLNSLR